MLKYCELYKKSVKSSLQSLISDYIEKRKKSVQKEGKANSICEEPLPLPYRSDALTTSSHHESDFAPVREYA